MFRGRGRIGGGMDGFSSIWVGELVGVKELLLERIDVDGEVCGVDDSGGVLLSYGVVLVDDSFDVVGGVVSVVSVVTLGD
ncbi:hypothetical protein Tco_0169749 [Tanacetum coccineum]